MSLTKNMDQQVSATCQKQYSSTYTAIRNEAESKWPAWKVSAYNSSVAVSAHAKKVNEK